MLKSSNTSPELTYVIQNILNKGRNDEDINFNQYTISFKIRDTVKDQQEGLGWYNFLLGI